ncbi:MAG: hypothetical protein KDA77_00195 [Planctomycetaceae bacterium]|nr:hypothetical protein [Planctomycetaceae bacterium]
MKIKRDELLLFYLPVSCLFLLSPAVVSSWWKAHLAAPLSLVLIVSFLSGILLGQQRNQVAASVEGQQPLQKRNEKLRLSIQTDLLIGQSVDEVQTVIERATGTCEMTVYELPEEGIAFLECALNQHSNFEKGPLSGEILVDSGEIWLRDSDLTDHTYELINRQSGDSSIRLIIDEEQQVRGAVICPPYGDGGYRYEKNKTGFKLELIPGVFSKEESRQ